MTTINITMPGRYLFIVLFLVFTAIQIAGALMCYQCADTKINTPCYTDYEGLTNTSRGRNDTYKKNCTDSNPRWDRCVIETHKKDGGTYNYFKRGCHDGVYFHKAVADKEFVNLTANNFTTCAKPGSFQVCFTFCNTDYCNGPQPVYTKCEKEFYTNKTIPEDVYCGGNGIHDNSLSKLIAIYIMLYVVWIFRHEL